MRADHDTVPVSVRFRAWHNRLDNQVGETTHTFQQFDQLPVFDLELCFVPDVLVLAPAASTKVPASRLDPLWGRFQYLEQFSAGEVLFYLGKFDFNKFAGQHKRDKNYEIIYASDPFATKGNVGNLHLYLLTDLQLHSAQSL